MSEIFKKISSIEPDDHAMARDLNIRPTDVEPRAERQTLRNPDDLPRYITQEAHYKAINRDDPLPGFRWVTPVAITTIVLWVFCVYAVIFGFIGSGSTQGFTATQWIGLALLTFVPALIIGTAAYACKQLAKLSGQAQNLSATARELTQPDEEVIGKTAVMSRAVTTEIENINSKVNTAISRMATLQDFIQSHNQKLDQSSLLVTDRIDRIDSILSKQRESLGTMADSFDERMSKLSETLTTQTEHLAKSAILSEQKIQEARMGVESAAEKIAAATETVRANTVDASSALTMSHSDIEKLGEDLRSKAEELDAAYRKHTDEVRDMLATLNSEQSEMGTVLEDRLEKLRDISMTARASAETLTTASQEGRKTVEALGQAAKLSDTAIKRQFADLENMVTYSNKKAENITDLAARKVRESLDITRQEIARIEDDMMAMQERLKTTARQAEPVKAPELTSLTQEQLGRLRLTPMEDDGASAILPASETKGKGSNGNGGLSSTMNLHLQDETKDDSPQLSLSVEPLNVEEDIKLPDANADIKNKTETVVRTSSAPEVRSLSKKKKEKSGWGWRDILSGLERPDDVSPVKAESLDENGTIVETLSGLGLAPGAVVDDGCIIEASTVRANNGAYAMSQIVCDRLGDPVHHLHQAMESDPDFKTDAQAFAEKFSVGVNAIKHDKDSLRSYLASENGRAFLLCHAALNI